MKPKDLILTGATVVTANEAWDVFSAGAVVIRRDNILEVGSANEINNKYKNALTIDCSGKTIIPGLINAHTHASMTLLRGLADDRRLDVWLLGYMMPVEREFVTSEFCRVGTQLACAEMIRSGVTCFADMYYFEHDVAQAVADVGMRALCSQSVLKFPTPDAPSLEDGLLRARKFIEHWHGHSLILPSVGPHAPYTSTREMLEACAALALEYDVPVHIHIAETAKEVEESRSQRSMPVVPWVKKQGLFDAKVLAAHCVHLDSGEISTLQHYQAGVAHCPTSNLKLASGIAPITEMLDVGLNVGIGTDGPASNNDLDMFEETRLAAFLAKGATNDPTVVPARQAFAMATIMGARAMHMSDITGSLEVGKRADLVVLDLDVLHNTPTFQRDQDSIYSQIVYVSKSSDVSDVMVNGEWLMQNRQLLTVDEDQLTASANDYAIKIDDFLMEREQSLLSKLVAIGGMERQESFEIQAKVRITDPQKVIDVLQKHPFNIIRHVRYQQYDTYFLFGESEDYRLRIREDDLVDTDGKVENVRYRLTLLGPAKEKEFAGSILLSRSRYLAPSLHTLRFYREYFVPDEEREVEKDRLRWQVSFRDVEFYVNLDRFNSPDLGMFVEVKSRTWSQRDAEDKAELIAEVLSLFGANPEDVITEDYSDFVQ
ncbi:MAG TPA: amidohydrolase [Chloroflexi bacterium]|nr:amidohydrolase [Chloroflexota bacterium]